MSLSLAEIQRLMDSAPMIRFLGMRVDAVDASNGLASFTLPMRAELARAAQSDQFHGGAIAMLVDTAGDFAVGAMLGGAVPTINLRVDFLRPAAGEKLLAEAQVRRLGRTIGVVDVDVRDGEARLVAVGRGTYSARLG